MTLSIGETAPALSLPDQHGRRPSLETLRGDGALLLVFFPFAFSSVCTGELMELRDSQDRIHAAGGRVVAASCDPMFTLRVLADRDRLEFPLLSDFWPHGATASAYGAFDPAQGCPTRSSFVVDAEGVVRWSVHNPMGEARSMEDYLAALRTATGGRRR